MFFLKKYLLDLEDFEKNSNNLVSQLDNEWGNFLSEANEKTYNIIQDDIDVDFSYSNYNPDNLNTLIMPRLFIDYNTIKPGFYMISTDVLDTRTKILTETKTILLTVTGE